MNANNKTRRKATSTNDVPGANRRPTGSAAAKLSIAHLVRLDCVRLLGGNQLISVTEYSSELMIVVAL
jgi:hypothetical protein